MLLPAWFTPFCEASADRFAVLSQALRDALIPFEVVNTGRFRHLQVRYARPPVPAASETVLIAHYDRVDGTPGANDNGASVLALVDYLRRPRKQPALRVVFTDGEELGPGGDPLGQGSHALARHWGPVPGLFPVVFDMTGIGDTVVLGRLGGSLAPSEAYDRQRLRAKRFLSTCGAGDTVEISTPFSDDLGFFLAGIPAVQISLLPRKEALAYRRGKALPPAWSTMHGPEDTVEALWPQSRGLMAEILTKLENYPGFRPR